MNCRKFEDLFALHVEGDLPRRKQRAVDEHMAVCEACRDFAARLEASQSAVKDLRNEAVDAEALEEITQLRSIFAYQHFRLLDTAVVRSRSMTTAQLSGVLSFRKDDTARYRLRLRPMVVTGEKTRSIRIDDLLFNTQVSAREPSPGGTQMFSSRVFDANITANIDVKEGQKVVVGKTGLEGADRALILVLSAKIVD